MEPTFALGIEWVSKLYKKLKTIRGGRQKELNALNEMMIGNPKDLTRYYLEPKCLKSNPADKYGVNLNTQENSIFKEIMIFLNKKDFGNQPGSNQLIVLSGIGMGKTSLLVMLKLLQVTAIFPRKPYFVIKALGKDKLDNLDGIEDKGNKVLLLDALEEDPKTYGGESERLKRLLDILKDTQHFLKVIITCRTQFLPKVSESPIDIVLPLIELEFSKVSLSSII